MRRVATANSSSFFVWVATLGLALPLVAAGDVQPPVQAEPVAAVKPAGQTLTFTPKVVDGMMLTVSGPRGIHSSRDFAPGEAPTFVPADVRGGLPDGEYKYELRTQPQVDRKRLQMAEDNDDDQLIAELSRIEREQVVIQAGAFKVVGGAIVVPAPDLESPAFSHVSDEAHAHSDDTHVHRFEGEAQ